MGDHLGTPGAAGTGLDTDADFRQVESINLPPLAGPRSQSQFERASP